MAIANGIYLNFVHETNPYTAIMDTEDPIQYTLRKGRYSDKQTSKLSVPFSPLMYRLDTKLTIDLFGRITDLLSPQPIPHRDNLNLAICRAI